MRALYRLTKSASAVVNKTLDFNPWLQSISAVFGSATVDDVPDVVESYTVNNGVVAILLSGGVAGQTYRITVICTATNGLTRTVVLELAIQGVAAATSPTSLQELLTFLQAGAAVGTGVTRINFTGATLTLDPDGTLNVAIAAAPTPPPPPPPGTVPPSAILLGDSALLLGNDFMVIA
jgi:hypothetical protein